MTWSEAHERSITFRLTDGSHTGTIGINQIGRELHVIVRVLFIHTILNQESHELDIEREVMNCRLLMDHHVALNITNGGIMPTYVHCSSRQCSSVLKKMRLLFQILEMIKAMITVKFEHPLDWYPTLPHNMSPFTPQCPDLRKRSRIRQLQQFNFHEPFPRILGIKPRSQYALMIFIFPLSIYLRIENIFVVCFEWTRQNPICFGAVCDNPYIYFLPYFPSTVILTGLIQPLLNIRFQNDAVSVSIIYICFTFSSNSLRTRTRELILFWLISNFDLVYPQIQCPFIPFANLPQ